MAMGPSQSLHELINKGLQHAAEQRWKQALKCFDKALKHSPENAGVWFNKGLVFTNTGRNKQALLCYERALELKPADADAWFAKGITLADLGRNEESLECYLKALEINPRYNKVWMHLGIAYSSLGDYQQALTWLDKDLSIRPGDVEVLFQKGRVLIAMEDYSHAQQCLEHALKISPHHVGVLKRLGDVHSERKNHEKSLECYLKAYSIDPQFPELLENLIARKMELNDWSGLEDLLSQQESRLRRNEGAPAPFTILGLFDSPFLQLRAAQIFTRKMFVESRIGPNNEQSTSERVRIGYFSSGFRDSPVGIMISEIIELHDRQKFEVIGFSLYRARVGDPLREKLEKAFDRLIDVDDKSDQEIATLSQEMGVDIAVDLSGFTEHTRTEVFGLRPAPINVNYLGYPGSMGAGFIDYIIADSTVVTEQTRKYFSEKVASLPDTYWPGNTALQIQKNAMNREMAGLPNSAFVFCCFNRNEKISPQIFSSWMHILRAVPGSVLWLYNHSNSEIMMRNLCIEAERQGVDPGRIYFAERVHFDDNLARHKLADLFLDTVPFNAITTSSIALSAGLPVLTLQGNSFAARGAASQLKALGLPELVTTTHDEYEAAAIELATNPERLLQLRQKLEKNRQTMPLFDAERYVRNLESAYLEMYGRYRNGLPPEDFDVVTK